MSDDPLFAFARRVLDSRIPSGAARVLDVGCGDQRVRPQAVGVDLHPREGTTVQADAARLPFRAGTFDAAACNLMYPGHTRGSSTRGVRELSRVLRRGGVLAFSFQNHFNPIVWARWMARRFFREARADAMTFSPWSVSVRLRGAGFEISEVVSISMPMRGRLSGLVHRFVTSRPLFAPVWGIVGRKR